MREESTMMNDAAGLNPDSKRDKQKGKIVRHEGHKRSGSCGGEGFKA